MKKAITVLMIWLLTEGASAQHDSFEVLNPKVGQGEVLVIKIAPQWMPPATSNPSISVFGNRYIPNKYGEVFVGIPLDAKLGIDIVTLVEYGRGVRLSWDYEEVEVVPNDFPVRIRGPFTPTPKWRRERQSISQAFNLGDYSERYFDGEFIKPLDEIIVDEERMIGEESSPFGQGHNGIDLTTMDPKTGKHKRPVKAINSGKVALIARNYSTEGNMVIIDHGSGIFSVYMHLSKFLVSKVGQTVKGGDVIAMSGDTGRAKRGGAHLHFSIKVRSKDGKSDVYIDPLGFIAMMNQLVK